MTCLDTEWFTTKFWSCCTTHPILSAMPYHITITLTIFDLSIFTDFRQRLPAVAHPQSGQGVLPPHADAYPERAPRRCDLSGLEHGLPEPYHGREGPWGYVIHLTLKRTFLYVVGICVGGHRALHNEALVLLYHPYVPSILSATPFP